MEHIGQQIERAERNMRINSSDPIALHGFTQVPNFILRDSAISIGAKTVYALLLSYAWHNDLCFPGQDRLAKDVGMGIASVLTLKNHHTIAIAVSRAARARLILARIAAPSAFQV